MKLLTIALLLIACLGCSHRGSPVGGAALAPTDPHAMFQAYEENAVAADLQYKDKPVLLRGRIRKLDQDGKGRYYAGMSVYSSEDDGGPFPSVCCYIAEADLKKFAALDPKKVPLADVEGIVRGKQTRLGSVKGWSVVVEECRLVSVK